LLELGGPKGLRASCSLVYRGADVELRCEVATSANAVLQLRDGEYAITRTVGDGTVSRHVQHAPGTTTSL